MRTAPFLLGVSLGVCLALLVATARYLLVLLFLALLVIFRHTVVPAAYWFRPSLRVLIRKWAD